MSSVFLKGLYIGTVVGAATTEIVRKFADNIDDNDATIKNSKNSCVWAELSIWRRFLVVSATFFL